MKTLAMSIPYVVAMIVFLGTYVGVVWLTGPYASTIIAPIISLVAAILVLIFARNIFERKSHSHD